METHLLPLPLEQVLKTENISYSTTATAYEYKKKYPLSIKEKLKIFLMS